MERFGFGAITKHILQRLGITPHPIDAQVLKSFNFFDAAYVQNAEQLGYNKTNFF